ncbi:DUF4254 domain-containing protein [Amycolatopsis keratiniphila]|uniref:DUF4254 domain-containing protein n=1 Tax=Amycolatopsis keratiniphila TaxID=129921 RepID=UPI00087D5925|nr:DUF4254 domain-containing protein [Amycolatopsis keratiniphila]OLZ50320.1 hypothetical protein BS330_29095 [Amycolatopsis keratiniphila subsp. nogabecina]SDU67302.1 Protein of unknown function [Amycolatopsis keratiniphila]
MTVSTSPARTPADAVPLPAGRAILLAFHGIHDSNPVLAAAHELAVLNLARADIDGVFDDPDADDTRTARAARKQRHLDREIARHAERIDDHATRVMPVSRGGTLHSETVGALITRLATLWQYSQQLAVLPVEDQRTHSASAALAELTDAYDDLIHDVRTGRRHLPRHQITGPGRRE